MLLRRSHGWALSLLALAVVGCQTGTVSPGPKATVPAASGLKLEAGALLGVLRTPPGFKAMPAGLIGNDGATLIGNDGAALIGNDGAALIGNDGAAFQAPSFSLLASGESSLSGVEVVLCDAQGRRLPNSPTATTNEAGEYLLRGVKAGSTCMVSAGLTTATGKPAPLQSLVRPSEEGNRLNINTASSLVTRALVAEVKGALGFLDNGRFEKASLRADAALGTKLPDLSDPKAVTAWITTTRSADAELSQLLSDLSTDLAGAAVAPPTAQPKPSPTPTPSPVAPASSAPIAVASPTPTPEATLQPEATPTPGQWPQGGLLYVKMRFALTPAQPGQGGGVSVTPQFSNGAPATMIRKVVLSPDGASLSFELAYPAGYFQSLSYTLKVGSALVQNFTIKADESVVGSFQGSSQGASGSAAAQLLVEGDALTTAP